MNMTAVQARVVAWHTARFPNVTASDVALKAAAELGEFAESVGSRAPWSPGPRGDIPAEAADVVIALMATVGRWTDSNLLREVEAKLDVLEDPSSGHRSAAVQPGLFGGAA